MQAQLLHIRHPSAQGRVSNHIRTMCGHFCGPLSLTSAESATCSKCVTVALTQVGSAVRVNRCDIAPHGYAGTVTEVCTGQLDGMVVVRLGQRGKVCVGLSELHQCPGCRND